MYFNFIFNLSLYFMTFQNYFRVMLCATPYLSEKLTKLNCGTEKLLKHRKLIGKKMEVGATRFNNM